MSAFCICVLDLLCHPRNCLTWHNDTVMISGIFMVELVSLRLLSLFLCVCGFLFSSFLWILLFRATPWTMNPCPSLSCHLKMSARLMTWWFCSCCESVLAAISMMIVHHMMAYLPQVELTVKSLCDFSFNGWRTTRNIFVGGLMHITAIHTQEFSSQFRLLFVVTSSSRRSMPFVKRWCESWWINIVVILTKRALIKSHLHYLWMGSKFCP